MASPLVWKIYFDGELIAATKHAEDAAALAALREEGTVVKYAGRVMWREGIEGQPAALSYDYAAGVMWERRQDMHMRNYRRWQAAQAAYAASMAAQA